MCVHLHVEIGWRWSSSIIRHIIFFSQGISLNQQIAKSARCDGQLASVILLSPPSQRWNHTHMPLHMATQYGSGEENTGRHACTASPLPTEPSPQFLIILLLFNQPKENRKEKERGKNLPSFSASLLKEMTEGIASVKLKALMTKREHPHSPQISTRCKMGKETF